MAKYFRVTIGTKLISSFEIMYDTVTDVGNFNRTAELYNKEDNSYRPAINVTYNELTQYNWAIVRTDDDVHKLKIIDQNEYCGECISNQYGKPFIPASEDTIYINNFIPGEDGEDDSFPVFCGMSGEFLWDSVENDGFAHFVQNNSDEDVYLRLTAKVDSGATGGYYLNAIAEIAYDQDGNESTNTNKSLIIQKNTFGSGNTIYSQNTWLLKSGKYIGFGIDLPCYNTDPADTAVKYSVSFSTNDEDPQTEITKYI